MRCPECGMKECCGAMMAPEIERLREAESILKELLETVKRTPLKSFADLLSDEWINIVRQTEKFLDNG